MPRLRDVALQAFVLFAVVLALIVIGKGRMNPAYVGVAFFVAFWYVQFAVVRMLVQSYRIVRKHS